MRLAVIPARGGSKRIPRKNIKEFGGKPLIAWSIEAALKSKCFDRVIVSTDDVEISNVAKNYGADVPFIRPGNLSDDFTGTIPVIQHAIQSLSSDGTDFQEVCCLYATAPFVRPGDISRGLHELNLSDASYAFSVTKYPFPIQRAVRLNEEGRVQMFSPEMFSVRSQDLEEAYHDAGQFYWGKTQAWLRGTRIFSVESVPVHLPMHLVQDIDTEEDWIRAEWMFKAFALASGEN